MICMLVGAVKETFFSYSTNKPKAPSPADRCRRRTPSRTPSRTCSLSGCAGTRRALERSSATAAATAVTGVRAAPAASLQVPASSDREAAAAFCSPRSPSREPYALEEFMGPLAGRGELMGSRHVAEARESSVKTRESHLHGDLLRLASRSFKSAPAAAELVTLI